jgi:myo-inositol-1(or 4)-monophosphatase
MPESPRTVAIAAALEAGTILRDLFGRIQHVRHKGAVDLVTEADELSEHHILEKIRAAFPHHRILSEEHGRSIETREESPYHWIVDPLDGTVNYAHGYPIFAISIALEVNGIVELGVVYVPPLDELFVAERGAGATLNGEPIHVSSVDTLMQSMVVTGFPYSLEVRGRNVVHWGNFIHATQAVRRDGSAALDLCYVAAGRFDGFWEESLNAWDTAAGALMVTEAGGLMSDFQGNPFSIYGRRCLASNGLIHDQMIDVLERVGE